MASENYFWCQKCVTVRLHVLTGDDQREERICGTCHHVSYDDLSYPGQRVTIVARESYEGMDLVWSTQEEDGCLHLRVDTVSHGVRKHCAAVVPSPFDIAQLTNRDFEAVYMRPMRRALVNQGRPAEILIAAGECNATN